MYGPKLRLGVPAALLFLPLSLLLGQEEVPKLRLPETVVPSSYQAELSLDPAKPNFSGSITIEVTVNRPVKIVWLNAADLKVQEASFSSGSNRLVAKVIADQKEFLGLEFESPLAAGSGQIRIRYTGDVRQQDSSGIFHMQDNGNNYIYTQFESTDARAAFPCFDEPSFKVPWQLTLNVPASDAAISNTSPLKTQTQGDRKIYSFGKTKPLPSYLVAFGVGPFDFVDAGKAGRNHVPVRIVTPKGHADEAQYAAQVTATIITRLESYFNIPFPYEKSDQVAIPVTFGFGAMENAGMVTYAQTLILAKPSSDTEMRRRGYASVAAHELAHQWFGDLVTTAWWNDIWLNEAFATWMEQKLIAEWKPEWNTRVEDVGSKLYAEGEDSLISARKIRQEIKTKDDISNAFDGITYQKGAAVIGMFESWVGPEQFRKGVQTYLKQYAFRNASAPEFLDSVSSASKKNLTAAFSTFLNQAGVPLVSAALDCNGGKPVLHLEQERALPLGSKGSTDQVWQIPVCIRYGTGNEGTKECKLMTEAKTDLVLKGNSCPAWVEANDDAVGYYQVNYRGGLLSALGKGDVQSRLTAPERVDLMGNAQSLAGTGKLPVGEALGLVEVFHADPERQVIQSAIALAREPRVHLVPDELRPNYQRFIRKTFGDQAHQLGWVSKGNEAEEEKLLRPNLLSAVAMTGGDQELKNEANQLTDRWLQDPSAIDPTMVVSTVGTSAYYGDKAFFEKLLAQLNKTKDRQERGRILRAMQYFRDPAAIEAGMNAVLSKQIPFIEGSNLLFAGQGAEATRKMSFEFMKAHFEQLAKERPTGGGFDAGALFPRVGSEFCDANSKAELEQFFRPRAAQFSGAPRALDQVLESIDVCVATKQEQEPGVAAFLKNF